MRFDIPLPEFGQPAIWHNYALPRSGASINGEDAAVRPCLTMGICSRAQDRHSDGHATRQLATRPPGRDSAFGGGKSRAAASRTGGGGQSAFGLQQRMHFPAAIDISGLIAAPAQKTSVVAGPSGEGYVWRRRRQKVAQWALPDSALRSQRL